MWFLSNVGYFLNPRYQYSDTVHNDGEVLTCTIDVIRRLSRNSDDRIDAEREVYRCYIQILCIYLSIDYILGTECKLVISFSDGTLSAETWHL